MHHKNENIKLRILTWNLGFSSLKKELNMEDGERFQKIVKIVKKINPDVVAFQEVANKTYLDNKRPFDFLKIWERIEKDIKLKGHFEAALSLGVANSFPYGKYELLKNNDNVLSQISGTGIFVRETNKWQLENLYSENAHPTVEIQRALPYPLYMGKDSNSRGGRDEEDRPILWARVAKSHLEKKYKIYVASLHLPTLLGEEKNIEHGQFNSTQKNIFNNILRIPSEKMKEYNVDRIGAELRIYMLRQIVWQAQQLENYWQSENKESECIFILAGDFNFSHVNESHIEKSAEQFFLENSAFEVVKKSGASRVDGIRLHDNVWVRCSFGERSDLIDFSEHIWLDKDDLGGREIIKMSDHLPVTVDINFK